MHLDLIDQHTRAIDDLTARIEVVIEPFRAVRDLIATLPGISTGVADVTIAENGADMTRLSAARGHDTYLSAKHRRIASRRGPIKALVAVEHAMLLAIWHMLTNGVLRRPRRRLLHPPQPRQNQEPRHRSAPQDGLRRHPQPAADRRGSVNLRIASGSWCHLFAQARPVTVHAGWRL